MSTHTHEQHGPTLAHNSKALAPNSTTTNNNNINNSRGPSGFGQKTKSTQLSQLN